MGMLDFLAMTTPNSTSFSLTDPNAWAAYFGGAKSTSGVVVSRDTSLGYPAVWRGVNLISGDVAKLPLETYRVRPDGGKDRADTHPAHRLLKISPNSEMTPFVFKQTLTAHALLTGNGYAWILRKGSGDAAELIPLNPDSTWPYRENGRLLYLTTYEGGSFKLLPENVLHIKGLGFDGLCGYSVVQKLQESLGLGLALQRYGSVYFKNNGRPGMVVELPHALKDAEAVERFKRAWGEANEGVDNAHKVKLLEAGAKLSMFQVKNDEAQFLQSREFEIRQIANVLGCPPHKLGDSSRVAYNSLEQENQSYLDDCLDPRLVNWEEECEVKLLRTAEHEGHTHIIEFTRQALVRANLSERYAAYQIGVNSRIILPNEARIKENMNPIPGGDEFPALAAAPAQPEPEEEDDFDAAVALASVVDALVARIESVESQTTTQLVETTQRLFGELERQRADLAAVAALELKRRDQERRDRETEAQDDEVARLRLLVDAMEPEPDPREQRIRERHRALVVETVRRMTHGLGVQAGKQARKPHGYHDWLDGLEAANTATLLDMLDAPLGAIEAYWGPEIDRAALAGEFFRDLHARLLGAGDGDPDEFVVRVEAACVLAEQELPSTIADGLILERRTYELTESAA